MRWKGWRGSGDIKDRSGLSGGGVFLVVILIAGYVFLKATGIDPAMVLDGGDTLSPQISVLDGDRLSPRQRDEMTGFIAEVLAETDDVWSAVFQGSGVSYRGPGLVLFSGQAQSGCGSVSAATGPFYCPADRMIYIELAFYSGLAQHSGAAGAFAQAHVLARAVGQHIQNLTGVLPELDRRRQAMGAVEADDMSLRIELQADCFTGIWAHDTDRKRLPQYGGPDAVPGDFHRATPQQRERWFSIGRETGRLDACDTFDGPV